MSFVIVPILALAVVIIAGNSLVRKGQWSRRTHFWFVAGITVLCGVTAGLVYLARGAPR